MREVGSIVAVADADHIGASALSVPTGGTTYLWYFRLIRQPGP